MNHDQEGQLDGPVIANSLIDARPLWKSGTSNQYDLGTHRKVHIFTELWILGVQWRSHGITSRQAKAWDCRSKCNANLGVLLFELENKKHLPNYIINHNKLDRNIPYCPAATHLLLSFSFVLNQYEGWMMQGLFPRKSDLESAWWLHDQLVVGKWLLVQEVPTV